MMDFMKARSQKFAETKLIFQPSAAAFLVSLHSQHTGKKSEQSLRSFVQLVFVTQSF